MQIYRPTALTPNYTATISAIGFITVLTVGVVACIAIIFLLIWGCVQLALLLLQSTVEGLSLIGTTYTTADPFIRLFILAGSAFLIYRMYVHFKTGKVKP